MCSSLTFPNYLGFNPFPLIIVNKNFIVLHLGQIKLPVVVWKCAWSSKEATVHAKVNSFKTVVMESCQG